MPVWGELGQHLDNFASISPWSVAGPDQGFEGIKQISSALFFSQFFIIANNWLSSSYVTGN